MGKINDFLFDEEWNGKIIHVIILTVMAIIVFFALQINALTTENLQLKNEILYLKNQPKPQLSFQSSSVSLWGTWKQWSEKDFRLR